MKYSMKNTKEELLKALDDYSHLSEAVESKDFEIHGLTESLINKELEIKNYKKLIEEHGHLAEAVESKDEEINRLLKRIDELRISFDTTRAEEIQKVKESQEKMKTAMQYEIEDLRATLKKYGDVEKLQKAYDVAVEENNKLVTFINSYVQAFRNTLKVSQASLDNAIELEALLFEKLQQK